MTQLFLKHSLAALCALALCVLCACKSVQRGTLGKHEVYMLIGSYEGKQQEGIKVYALDTHTGQARYVSGAKGMSGPSFLAPTADGSMVYAVGESSEPMAYTLSFDKREGRLALLGSQATHGSAPCHISLSPGEKWAVTANYMGRNVTALPISDNRQLGEASQLVPFEGTSIDPERQRQPHLHSTTFTPDGRYMLAADLGADRLRLLAVDEQNEALLHSQGLHDVIVASGSGPRHMVWHPNGKWMYLINELSGLVTAFAYHQGQFQPLQYVVADTVGARGSADIHVSPCGRHLYASNRLQADGLAIFAIDSRQGTLTRVGYQPTGIHPRNFGIAPGGRYVLVACRDTNEVQIFRRDTRTGLLTLVGQVSTPRPVCVKFVEGK